MAKSTAITIAPPRFKVAEFTIEGAAPFVQNRFSMKAKTIIHEKQEAGGTANKNKKRVARDFKADYKGSMYSCNGKRGIPAAAFRAAMIAACRTVGYKMTHAKLAVFIEADGFDDEDGTPLVLFTKGKPEYFEAAVRNATGVVDLRARAMWRPGWQAKPRVRFDLDMFTLEDVANLMMRVGMQVGIGEGRPNSKASCGQGWGIFSIVAKKEKDV